MADESRSKLRIVKLIDILKDETDAEHPLSTNEIINRLSDFGIGANRKTIYDDIETISENLYEIKTLKRSQNLYYLDEREFDPSEIQIIASAVNAAGFISEAQSKDLTERLYGLTSKYNREILKSSITLKNPYKHTNNSVFMNIESIINAIRGKKKIIFDYYHYNIDKEKEVSTVRTSPVDLIYSNDFYYCISYNAENNKYYTLRIDKMENVQILSDDMDRNTYNSKKYIDEKFSSKTFLMFDGEEVYVKLMVHKSIIDPILDRFGENQIVSKIDDEYAYVSVLVKEARTFYSWVASFGPRIKIVEPEATKEGFKKYIASILRSYEE